LIDDSNERKWLAKGNLVIPSISLWEGEKRSRKKEVEEEI
jgi:hypothetical protein